MKAGHALDFNLRIGEMEGIGIMKAPLRMEAVKDGILDKNAETSDELRNFTANISLIYQIDRLFALMDTNLPMEIKIET